MELHMQQYSTFIFDSYDCSEADKAIRLHYALFSPEGMVRFTETIKLPEEMPFNPKDPDLDRALFNLHLAGGISYYKTCLPKTIEIRSGKLTSAQASFWNTMYEKGLGEFFYRNNINFHGVVNFPATAEHFTPPSALIRSVHLQPIVPIGGGKDSTLTMELLKEAGFDVTLLRIGKHPLIEKAAEIANLPLWNIGRLLSPKLFELNAEGALNGHVPITAYINFLSVVIGLLSGRSDVVFSNERSANEGNIEFHGMEINHQWSKSIEFEQAFQQYVSTFVTKNVTCFSLLRTLGELKIVELFTNYPQYFSCFSSCNRNWKLLKGKRWTPSDMGNSEEQARRQGGDMRKVPEREGWCGTCPKCAFAFSLFAAFLPKADLVQIFGKNLFADASLMPLFKELLGLEGFKPFECVGTPEETAAAFILARRRDDWDDDVIMKMFIDEALPSITDEEEMIGEAMLPTKEHCIPDEFLSIIERV